MHGLWQLYDVSNISFGWWDIQLYHASYPFLKASMALV